MLLQTAGLQSNPSAATNDETQDLKKYVSKVLWKLLSFLLVFLNVCYFFPSFCIMFSAIPVTDTPGSRC